MSGNDNRQKITVEALLRVKRSERPQGDFWESFEQDLHRRRLSALVERPAWRDLLFIPAVKAVGFALPALLLMGLAYAWFGITPDNARPLELVAQSMDSDSPDPLKVPEAATSRPVVATMDLDTARASSQFVMDALHTDSSQSNRFRKVLYTPAIRLSSSSGASYVRDNLSSSSYQVTTADVQLGRNF